MRFLADVHDPREAPENRVLRYAALAPVVVASLFVSLGLVTFLLACAAALLTHLVAPRRRAYRAAVSVSPGLLEIHRRGKYQRLRPSDLRGASIGEVGDHAVLALMTDKRARQPLVLELTHAEAQAARAALGLASGGIGYLRWDLAASRIDRSWRALRVLAALGVLVVAGTAAFPSVDSGVIALTALAGVVVGAAVLAFARIRGDANAARPFVGLDSVGVTLGDT